MEWRDWSNILFQERQYLPACSGLYAIADPEDCVWYVGQAKNLKRRWNLKRYYQYSRQLCSNRRRYHRLYWKPVGTEDLPTQHHQYTHQFYPELDIYRTKNYCLDRVRVLHEIQRLLRSINITNRLFPVIHSVIAGEYHNELGRHCITVIVQINDFQCIDRSMRCQRSPEVRKAWVDYKTHCGRDGQTYIETYLPVYRFQNYQFEFLEVSELLEFLETRPDIHDRYIGVADIFGVPVKVLKDLTLLDQVSIVEEYCFTDFDGKKHLTDAAYLNYRKPMLTCLESL